MKRKNLDANNKYYRDDNWRQAQNIVSMIPLDIRSEQRDRNWYHEKRHIRTDFSDEEKATILSRVRVIGAEQAALEV